MVADKQNTILRTAILDPVSSMRELTKNNLYYFIQYLWPEYSQQDFVPNWHIEFICKELEIVAKKVGKQLPREHDLIINVPPGTTKTATVSIFFPIWCWVNWFWMRFITASYTQPLSLESAEYCREIVRSERFKALFPEIDIKEDKDTKSNFRVIKREFKAGYTQRQTMGGNRFSTSVGGSVTGFHGHINIVDDPVDPNRVLSETEVRKANHWMDNTLPMRKVDKKVTVTILVMQRLHQDDPTGHWLNLDKNSKRSSLIRHICLPGEIKNYADKVNPPQLKENYINGLLDVNRLNWDALNEILNRGQYVYGSQIGQDPVPLGGGMFKVDKIITITRLPESHEVLHTVRYWDKAGTEGGTGAYTAGVKMSKLKNGKFVVEDVKRGRWASEEREKVIRLCAEADGHKCHVMVEQEPGSGGKESAEMTVKNLAGYIAGKDRPVGDKVYRADPYSVQVNNGNVMVLTGPWNADYLDELKNFPSSTFKDQTDASSGAFAKLTALKKAGTLRN